MVTCTFAGHREVYQSKVDVKIEQTIQKLLLTDTEFIFYTGGMGDFDSKCASAVRSAKRRNPGLNIRLALVLPYMSNRLNTDKDFTSLAMMTLLFQWSFAMRTTRRQ